VRSAEAAAGLEEIHLKADATNDLSPSAVDPAPADLVRLKADSTEDAPVGTLEAQVVRR
jgi:hypothetical protein